MRHDLRVPGARANIDHVVIGRTGVWVVDTKTTRALVRARWRKVHFGDRPLDVASLRWETEVVADRLAAQLERAAGSDPDAAPGPGSGGPGYLAGVVRPIVVVHGRGLRRRGGRAGGVRVVAADDLLRHLRRGRRRLGRAQIRELSAALDVAFPPDDWYDRGTPGAGYEVDMPRSPMRAVRSHG